MEKEEIRDIILETMATSLAAQLRAVQRLREPAAEVASPPKSMSQMDMVEDILRRFGQPLHISRIIEEIQKVHGILVDRESLVSALSKKVLRQDRFVRTDKNTFALKGGKA